MDFSILVKFAILFCFEFDTHSHRLETKNRKEENKKRKSCLNGAPIQCIDNFSLYFLIFQKKKEKIFYEFSH